MPIAILMPLALLLAGCGAATRPADQTKPSYDFVLGVDDANRSVRIASGRWFGVRLTDNSSIGRQWRVAEVPANLRSEGFLYDGEADRAEGADTTKLFRFVGTDSGRGTLRLALEYRGEHRRNVEFEVITE